MAPTPLPLPLQTFSRPTPVTPPQSIHRSVAPGAHIALDNLHSSSRLAAGQLQHSTPSRSSRTNVIRSIIDSFDDEWEQQQDTFDNEDTLGQLSPASSRRSTQRYSWDRAASPDSVARSRRSRDYHGVSKHFRTLDEQREPDTESPIDAALPPVIPYTRPVSGLSHRTRSSISRFSFDFGRRRRSSSIGSLGSPPAIWKEKEASKNKLSAESWIRQGLANIEDTDREDSEHTMKTIRRMDSRDALRYPDYNVNAARSANGMSPPPDFPQAEHIIPKTPTTVPGSRGRLYLSDEPLVKDVSRSSSAVSDQAQPLDAADLNFPMPFRMSARNSFISDSVPTRTSSLRRKDSPNSARKKEGRRRKRRGGSARRESVIQDAPVEMEPSPELEEIIPDSTWADLGEDDSTVKRILQLRELRSQRLVEESTTSPLAANEDQHQPRSPQPPLRTSSSQHTPTRTTAAPPITFSTRVGSRAALSHANAWENSNAVERTVSRKGRLALNSANAYSSPLEKFNAAHHASLPSSPGTPKANEAATLNVPKSDRPIRTARRKSLVQALRSSSDHGRTPESKLSSDAKADGASAAGGLFRGRSMRRSMGLTSPSTDLSRKMSSRTRSASNVRKEPSMEASRPTNPVDTIDLAIRNYLGATRLSNRIAHPQSGREICFSDVGDPEGAAVVVCVGMGLTRYVTAFFDELAATLGLRLITLDRPGVGGSQPYPANDKSGPLSWPADVLAVCQHLDISSFSLLAHSAGAIYALATALVLPQMVTGKVHLLAPWVPLSQLEITSDPTSAPPPAGAIPRSQRILRALPASFLKAANSSFMTATSASLKPVSKRQLNASRANQRPVPSVAPSRTPAPAAPSMPARRESMMLMDQTMPTTGIHSGLTTNGTSSRVESRAGNHEELPTPDAVDVSSNDLEKDPNWYFSSAALEAIDDADRERQHQYMRELTLRTWDLATRDSNPATDLLICLERNRDIGFKYTDVNRQTVITHGSEDKRVPMGNVKWLADQVNQRAKFESQSHQNSAWDRRGTHSREGWADHEHAKIGCELRILQGEGHGLMASASIMSDVLTEIASYSANAFANGLSKESF